MLVVTSGPRLGDIESGSVAGATSARVSVVSGGLACLIGTAAIVVAFPALRRYGRKSESGAAAQRDRRLEPATDGLEP
jgi:hypothetical protein